MGDGYSVFWLHTDVPSRCVHQKLNLVSHSKKKKYFYLIFFCILITWSSKILVEKFPISGFYSGFFFFDSLYITFYCTGGHVIAPHFRQHELFRVRQK